MGRYRGWPGNASGKFEDAAFTRVFWFIEISYVQCPTTPHHPYNFFDDLKLFFRRTIMKSKHTNGLVERTRVKRKLSVKSDNKDGNVPELLARHLASRIFDCLEV